MRSLQLSKIRGRNLWVQHTNCTHSDKVSKFANRETLFQSFHSHFIFLTPILYSVYFTLASCSCPALSAHRNDPLPLGCYLLYTGTHTILLNSDKNVIVFSQSAIKMCDHASNHSHFTSFKLPHFKNAAWIYIRAVEAVSKSLYKLKCWWVPTYGP